MPRLSQFLGQRPAVQQGPQARPQQGGPAKPNPRAMLAETDPMYKQWQTLSNHYRNLMRVKESERELDGIQQQQNLGQTMGNGGGENTQQGPDPNMILRLGLMGLLGMGKGPSGTRGPMTGTTGPMTGTINPMMGIMGPMTGAMNPAVVERLRSMMPLGNAGGESAQQGPDPRMNFLSYLRELLGRGRGLSGTMGPMTIPSQRLSATI